MVMVIAGTDSATGDTVPRRSVRNSLVRLCEAKMRQADRGK